MGKEYPVKLIAMSFDPNVDIERLSSERQMYSLDPKLYSFYRVDKEGVKEIVKPSIYVKLNPRSKECRQVLAETGNF